MYRLGIQSAGLSVSSPKILENSGGTPTKHYRLDGLLLQTSFDEPLIVKSIFEFVEGLIVRIMRYNSFISIDFDGQHIYSVRFPWDSNGTVFRKQHHFEFDSSVVEDVSVFSMFFCVRIPSSKDICVSLDYFRKNRFLYIREVDWFLFKPKIYVRNWIDIVDIKKLVLDREFNCSLLDFSFSNSRQLGFLPSVVNARSGFASRFNFKYETQKTYICSDCYGPGHISSICVKVRFCLPKNYDSSRFSSGKTYKPIAFESFVKNFRSMYSVRNSRRNKNLLVPHTSKLFQIWRSFMLYVSCRNKIENKIFDYKLSSFCQAVGENFHSFSFFVDKYFTVKQSFETYKLCCQHKVHCSHYVLQYDLFLGKYLFSLKPVVSKVELQMDYMCLGFSVVTYLFVMLCIIFTTFSSGALLLLYKDPDKFKDYVIVALRMYTDRFNGNRFNEQNVLRVLNAIDAAPKIVPISLNAADFSSFFISVVFDLYNLTKTVVALASGGLSKSKIFQIGLHLNGFYRRLFKDSFSQKIMDSYGEADDFASFVDLLFVGKDERKTLIKTFILQLSEIYNEDTNSDVVEVQSGDTIFKDLGSSVLSELLVNLTSVVTTVFLALTFWDSFVIPKTASKKAIWALIPQISKAFVVIGSITSITSPGALLHKILKIYDSGRTVLNQWRHDGRILVNPFDETKVLFDWLILNWCDCPSFYIKPTGVQAKYNSKLLQTFPDILLNSTNEKMKDLIQELEFGNMVDGNVVSLPVDKAFVRIADYLSDSISGLKLRSKGDAEMISKLEKMLSDMRVKLKTPVQRTKIKPEGFSAICNGSAGIGKSYFLKEHVFQIVGSVAIEEAKKVGHPLGDYPAINSSDILNPDWFSNFSEMKSLDGRPYYFCHSDDGEHLDRKPDEFSDCTKVGTTDYIMKTGDQVHYPMPAARLEDKKDNDFKIIFGLYTMNFGYVVPDDILAQHSLVSTVGNNKIRRGNVPDFFADARMGEPIKRRCFCWSLLLKKKYAKADGTLDKNHSVFKDLAKNMIDREIYMVCLWTFNVSEENRHTAKTMVPATYTFNLDHQGREGILFRKGQIVGGTDGIIDIDTFSAVLADKAKVFYADSFKQWHTKVSQANSRFSVQLGCKCHGLPRMYQDCFKCCSIINDVSMQKLNPVTKPSVLSKSFYDDVKTSLPYCILKVPGFAEFVREFLTFVRLGDMIEYATSDDFSMRDVHCIFYLLSSPGDWSDIIDKFLAKFLDLDSTEGIAHTYASWNEYYKKFSGESGYDLGFFLKSLVANIIYTTIDVGSYSRDCVNGVYESCFSGTGYGSFYSTVKYAYLMHFLEIFEKNVGLNVDNIPEVEEVMGHSLESWFIHLLSEEKRHVKIRDQFSTLSFAFLDISTFVSSLNINYFPVSQGKIFRVDSFEGPYKQLRSESLVSCVDFASDFSTYLLKPTKEVDDDLLCGYAVLDILDYFRKHIIRVTETSKHGCFDILLDISKTKGASSPPSGIKKFYKVRMSLANSNFRASLKAFGYTDQSGVCATSFVGFYLAHLHEVRNWAELQGDTIVWEGQHAAEDWPYDCEELFFPQTMYDPVAARLHVKKRRLEQSGNIYDFNSESSSSSLEEEKDSDLSSDISENSDRRPSPEDLDNILDSTPFWEGEGDEIHSFSFCKNDKSVYFLHSKLKRIRGKWRAKYAKAMDLSQLYYVMDLERYQFVQSIRGKLKEVSDAFDSIDNSFINKLRSYGRMLRNDPALGPALWFGAQVFIGFVVGDWIGRRFKIDRAYEEPEVDTQMKSSIKSTCFWEENKNLLMERNINVFRSDTVMKPSASCNRDANLVEAISKFKASNKPNERRAYRLILSNNKNEERVVIAFNIYSDLYVTVKHVFDDFIAVAKSRKGYLVKLRTLDTGLDVVNPKGVWIPEKEFYVSDDPTYDLAVIRLPTGQNVRPYRKLLYKTIGPHYRCEATTEYGVHKASTIMRGEKYTINVGNTDVVNDSETIVMSKSKTRDAVLVSLNNAEGVSHSTVKGDCGMPCFVHLDGDLHKDSGSLFPVLALHRALVKDAGCTIKQFVTAEFLSNCGCSDLAGEYGENSDRRAVDDSTFDIEDVVVDLQMNHVHDGNPFSKVYNSRFRTVDYPKEIDVNYHTTSKAIYDFNDSQLQIYGGCKHAGTINNTCETLEGCSNSVDSHAGVDYKPRFPAASANIKCHLDCHLMMLPLACFSPEEISGNDLHLGLMRPASDRNGKRGKPDPRQVIARMMVRPTSYPSLCDKRRFDTSYDTYTAVRRIYTQATVANIRAMKDDDELLDLVLASRMSFHDVFLGSRRDDGSLVVAPLPMKTSAGSVFRSATQQMHPEFGMISSSLNNSKGALYSIDEQVINDKVRYTLMLEPGQAHRSKALMEAVYCVFAGDITGLPTDIYPAFKDELYPLIIEDSKNFENVDFGLNKVKTRDFSEEGINQMVKEFYGSYYDTVVDEDGFVFHDDFVAKIDEDFGLQKCKARTIFVSPGYITVAMKSFFAVFSKVLDKDPHIFRTLLGVDASAPDGEIAFLHLINKAGEYNGAMTIWDADVSSFDIGLPKPWLLEAFKILVDCTMYAHRQAFKVQFPDKLWRDHHYRFNKVALALTNWFINHEYCIAGHRFRNLGYNPSGLPITTIINNVLNQILGISSLLNWVDIHMPDLYDDFVDNTDDYFYHQTYGDDSRSCITQKFVDICVERNIEPYNCLNFIETASWRGIKATPGSKSVKLAKYTTISDIIFLQRKARLVIIPAYFKSDTMGVNTQTVLVNALAPSSMFKMFAKVSESTEDPVRIYVSTVRSFMQELIPYGYDKFQNMASAIRQFHHPKFWPNDPGKELPYDQNCYEESLNWNYMLDWFVKRQLDENFEICSVVSSMRDPNKYEGLPCVVLEYVGTQN